ncbi:MAG: threonine/serine exporter family protein, partial [Erysipelotrichaceae bacterium]
LLGALIKYLTTVMSDRLFNKFIINFFDGLVIGFISLVGYKLFDLSYSTIIVGTIMIQVPGMLITNAILDCLNGDLVSSVVHIVESILIAIAIACGVGFVMIITINGGII